MSIIFHHVRFTHDSASEPLFRDLAFHAPHGWTGLIGANGTGKTTILRLAAGELRPEAGTISGSGRVACCPQRTDQPPDAWRAFHAAVDAEASRLRGILRIGADWGPRWKSLSHGERKRCQIAAALWTAPSILLVDEPTNHLDGEAASILRKALGLFRGVGLIVSHDRELLDALCDRCLFLEPPLVRLFPGGFRQASEALRREDLNIAREREQVKDEMRRLRRSMLRRQEEAGRADRRRSKRDLDVRDSDGRAKIDLARVTGKDGTAGRLVAQMQGRLQQVANRLQFLPVKPLHDPSFWLPGGRSPRNLLFSLPAGAIPLGGGRMLEFPDLFMAPTDRVAVTGPNGSGKSTLLHHLQKEFQLSPERLVMIPQEIDLETTSAIRRELRSLGHAQLGKIMTIVGCLGSDPERLLMGETASPGEIRKILLALGVAKVPHLIVMDEPTNHLDPQAIELLEEALGGCPGGLLLVSHDRRFLDRLTTRRWDLVALGGGSYRVHEC